MKQLIAIISIVLSISAGAADFPKVHPDSVVAKYGKPDRIKTTENDSPRPPIVTRMLEYKKERVRFTFFPDGPMGASPPYREWRLVGFQDPSTNAVITANEVEKRMKARAKAKP